MRVENERNTEMELSENTSQAEGLMINGGPMGVKGSVEVKEIPLNKIKLAKNSRLNVSDDEIAGLMQSIKQQGLLQPIGVSKSGSNFEIVYGNRRYLAVSKLGHSKIAAVVHTNKSALENDLQNLTENIQRRNISLSEAGRYISILSKEGLSYAEISVRLGVSKSYVESCIRAFQDVPEKFRNDLDVKTVNDRQRTPGKISIASATAIINAQKSFGLSAKEADQLFEAAKTKDEFAKENVPKYAAAIKRGDKNWLKTTIRTKRFQAAFLIESNEYDRLQRKYVEDGPFKSMSGLVASILKGETREKVKLI